MTAAVSRSTLEFAGVRQTLTLAVALAALAATLPAPATATFPGRNGRLAYADGAARKVWTARPNGSGKRRILNFAVAPKWSADGRQLVVLRRWRIAIADRDGSDAATVLNIRTIPRPGFLPWAPGEPSFSPDGNRLVFAAQAPDAPISALFTVNTDGTDLRRIYEQPTALTSATWSPNGNVIAFTTLRGAIATIRPDGGDYRERFTGRTPARELDFSPNGRRLLFVEERRDSYVTVLNLRSGAVHRIPRSVTGVVWDAVWSPDGTRIAYLSYALIERGDRPPILRGRISSMRPDGTDRRTMFPVTHRRQRFLPGSISWQPRPRHGRPRPARRSGFHRRAT